MCGIAGIFNYADPDHPVDRNLLVRMTRALAHRGPDAEGFHVQGGIGLGHRRLAIVDLSPTGAQPMPNDDGSSWICYNGEFYNHQDFRPRLESKGARFRGPSDTETLLRLMEHEGPDSLAAVSGIFGFAYWDGRNQTLTLARDHMGVKQVYFHDDGRRILFASEIKALLQDPEVPRDPDPEAINQYLHFHTALFERTFFRHIRVLRAGQFLRITRYGALARTYWSLDSFSKSPEMEEAQIHNLRSHLSHVVRQQLMSDVPVGSFFSGGIDSCAIAAQASNAGQKPLCFGVHFTGQGVTDERPYQEAAAGALGLDLRLITLDGAAFPDEFRRLMFHQDEPVIGPAMFPMAKVSALAAESVKVCLGGQAADEIFGGYARYALARPMQVVKTMLANRLGLSSHTHQVGGNLSKQLAEGGTLSRLARNLRHLPNWETSYFEHFAKVPQETWSRLFADPAFCDRQGARQLFRETVHRSPASDPLDKLMHWDTQTYLTGLFHQDDRMSMAAGVESRVPFADPRIVEFAFHVNPDMKLRDGASKWILRQAVSDVLPSLVLNRRKAGFDTPAESWIKGPHAGFVRDTLLSGRARQRGFWNPRAIESLLNHPGERAWFDVLWKVLSIEIWASVFLDDVVTAPPPAHEPVADHRPACSLHVQEFRELGVKGALARGLWELKTRTGLIRVQSQEPVTATLSSVRLPFSNPADVALAMREFPAVRQLASEATRGQILCFSKWTADYGNPIDWHRDPKSGHRWPQSAHWSKALGGAAGVDVKFTWEAARFPQAYLMARAAAFDPASTPDLAQSFESQVLSFIEANPPGRGIHWFSGQEVALRMFAWLFAQHVFQSEALANVLTRSLTDSGSHIAANIEYARHSVPNNHLLSEALGLLAAGRLLSREEWSGTGMADLNREASRQFYPDGGYIQQSHNYQRAALQIYLWASAFLRANGEQPPAAWLSAMERPLDFLLARQNPQTGTLPNFGANDGACPLLLAGGSFSDFRPVLQALSVATRGERLYDRGPWDEMALWLSGMEVPDLPLRKPERTSVSFAHTGDHVLRGRDTSNFCTFRCGDVLDRYSQIDMLHLDVCWRGEHVLVDGGSYQYNGAPLWHNHFLRTESHNTVQVDGKDQMLHFRQFKTLYWTEAKLLRFKDNPEWALCEGEHYGYRRQAGCTHRRSVLFAKDDLWVVSDTITGEGSHTARLHWLCGDYPFEFDAPNACLRLNTPKGNFAVSIFGGDGVPAQGTDVVAGASNPPRGWQSLHYGHKVPVPSLSATKTGTLPLNFVTVMCPASARISVANGDWTVEQKDTEIRFRIEDGSVALLVAELQP